MKKYTILIVSALICVLLVAAKPNGVTHLTSLWVGDPTATSNVTAGDNDLYVNGTMEVDGAVRIDGTLTATVVREVDLPIMAMLGNGNETAAAEGAVLSASTVPGVETDDGTANLVWADGEVSSAFITFAVPSNYSSGGDFRVIATESDSTTPNQIDFNVLVNTSGSAIDAAMTGQTPVALAGTTSTPSEVTLTVATDFAALAAGDWVTLRIWRDNVAAGTGDLEVKGVKFRYTSTQ